MFESELWRFMLVGYPLTVALESPVLLAGLSPRHPLRHKLLACFWLTAVTYPIVVVVLPILMTGATRGQYLLVAETFAPAAECLLFGIAFNANQSLPPGSIKGREAGWNAAARDYLAIVAANLCSFLVGEWLHSINWL